MAVDLYDLSDEELEAQFRAAKEELGETVVESPEDENGFIEEQESTDDDEIEVDDIEEELDLEQPEDAQDSDDDTSLDEDEEDDEEDDSEEEDDNPDGDEEESDEQTDETEEESEKEEQPPRKLKYKANGQDFEFTEQEIIERFGQVFGQSMNYTKKMQQIKPWRETIDALEDAGIGKENLGDLMKAIDVVKGDKDAIASILKQNNIDALDLDTENDNYTPKNYGRDDTTLAIRDVVDEISVDKEYDITHNILSKQWDEPSRQAFVKDPEMIRLLHVDVKSGTYDQVNSIAQKLKVYDSGRRSDLDYYKEASGQYFQNLSAEQRRAADSERRAAEASKATEEARRIAEVKSKQAKRVNTKEASAKRKAATPPKKGGSNKGVKDYLDDSDEGFEKWYKQLEEKM